MQCQFQLDKFQIESVAVILNGNFNSTLKTHTGELKTGMVVAPHQTAKNKFLLVLEVIVKPKKRNETIFFPYSVSIKGRGSFSFDETVEHKEVDRLLRINGAAILYGLLRGQVAQITAQSVHGQFLLPTANFIELYERSQKAPDKQTETVKKTAAPKKNRASRGGSPQLKL